MNIERYKLENGDFVLTEIPRFPKGNVLSRKVVSNFSPQNNSENRLVSRFVLVWYYTIKNAGEEIVASYTQMDIYNIYDLSKITTEEIKENLLKSWQTVERHFEDNCKKHEIDVKDTYLSEQEIQEVVEKLNTPRF